MRPTFRAPAREGAEENMKCFAMEAALVLLISAFVPGFAPAQNNLSDAHLRGTITDRSGAGVGGVHLTARDESDPQALLWKATSTTDGEFSLTLPTGKYHLVLQRTPFAPREFDVEVAGGETKTLDTRLDLERVSASVVVTA